jgi:hypothetical protein
VNETFPGLAEAADAVREHLDGAQGETTAWALAQTAVQAATLPLLAAAFADVSDAAGEEGLEQTALWLDQVSHELQRRTR